MRVSVVINTCDRGASLRQTLAALRHQTHPSFEVVVVNGPSSDGTEEVLAAFAGDIRAYRCPDRHLSKSRNVGIAHAAGEVVAFIDDDAVPEPGWLAGLAAAYADPAVGGAGGIVHDHTGAALQYEYSVCDRVAVPRFDVRPPFDRYCRPGADPFLYLQGTNCSFRRDVLVEVGGFNEEIEYYLDEVEVCMRVIDAGYRLAPLAGAAVHHKYLPSHIRDHKRVVFDPYSTVKNHCTFAVRNGPRTRPLTEVLDEVNRYVAAVRAGGRYHHEQGQMTDEQLAHFLRRLEQAVEVGIKRGLTDDRPFRRLPAADPGVFRPFPTLRPAGGRLKACFVSREYPPDRGGIGRFTADLAAGYGRLGHEVHVVTHSPTGHTVDFEGGVWVHRLPDVPPKGGAFRTLPLCHNLKHAANVYHEVARIHESCGGLDVVSAPVWLCEGAVCALDGRWPTVLTLMTTMKTVAELGGTASDPAHVAGMIALEAATVRRAGHVHAISRDILEKARAAAGGAGGTGYVVPLGTADVRDEYPRSRGDDGKVRILFVGRLERRKGVDVLLEAARRVLPEFPNAELVLVGRPNPTATDSYAADPTLDGRVVFAGEVGEAELMQAYADCDVFVLPSRYESFGLVLTEAMMFGRPVVAAAAGGPAEIVADGGNGFLVPPDDPAALADALRKLLADPALRARFGAWSRELYEAKFSADIMIANTVALHRQIAERWPATAPPGQPPVADRLKGLIAEATGAPPEVVQIAVRELLSPRFRQPVDHPLELARAWHAPDEEFVRAVYAVVLRRAADADGLRSYVHGLRTGMDRMAVVRALLFSDEARGRKTDTSWLAEFAPPADPLPAVVVDRQAAPPGRTVRLRAALTRVRARLQTTPGLGRVLRLVKHAVLLPVNVRRLQARADELAAVVHAVGRQAAAEQQAALREFRDLQQQLADRLAQVQEAATARDRQIQWLLSAATERPGRGREDARSVRHAA